MGMTVDSLNIQFSPCELYRPPIFIFKLSHKKCTKVQSIASLLWQEKGPPQTFPSPPGPRAPARPRESLKNPFPSKHKAQMVLGQVVPSRRSLRRPQNNAPSINLGCQAKYQMTLIFNLIHMVPCTRLWKSLCPFNHVCVADFFPPIRIHGVNFQSSFPAVETYTWTQTYNRMYLYSSFASHI